MKAVVTGLFIFRCICLSDILCGTYVCAVLTGQDVGSMSHNVRSECWVSCRSSAMRAAIYLNLLKPTGYGMHQQFNIQQLYVLPTLYLRVLYLSENKQRLLPLTA